MLASCALLVLLFCVIPPTLAHKRYKEGELVEVYGNKVGPIANPSETYAWASLPLCQPDQLDYERRGLGDVLRGDKKAHTMFDMPFRVDTYRTQLCNVRLTADNVRKLSKAVSQDYVFEFILDGMPVHGRIGRKALPDESMGVRSNENLLFNSFEFQIEYNNDEIITAVVHQDELTAATLPTLDEVPDEHSLDTAPLLPIYMSVTWTPTDTPYTNRMDSYVKEREASPFVEIHWISIVNSFVLVLLLTGFLSLILLRSLRNDFYGIASRDDEKGKGGEDDETGWKLLSHDVFRPPSHLNLLCALLGAGAQMIMMFVCILLLCFVGTFQPTRRGALYVAFLVIYALTSALAGYVSCMYYVRWGGTQWTRNIMTSAMLFSGPFAVIAGSLNLIAAAYNSTSSIPITTVILLIVIWGLVTFPLTVLGGIAGKQHSSQHTYNFPVPANIRPRELPHQVPWFASAWFQILFAGFLPFSAIYMELFFIFTSVWGYKLYTLYGILGIAVVLLLVVTGMITIALVYFQLTAEDYRWWWRSYICGASVGVFVYAYSVYFFLFRSEMYGFLQTAFFFGYSLCFSFAISLALGTMGFLSSHAFVCYIYSRAKVA